MYTSKRLDEECTAIYKLMKVMGSNTFVHAPVRRGTGCGRTSSYLPS